MSRQHGIGQRWTHIPIKIQNSEIELQIWSIYFWQTGKEIQNRMGSIINKWWLTTGHLYKNKPINISYHKQKLMQNSP